MMHSTQWIVVPHYVSRTREFKIAFPCELTRSFKILTVGVDYRWRVLDVPFECSFNFLMPRFLTSMIDGVYFALALAKEPEEAGDDEGELTVICLEMEKETFWRVDIPCDDDAKLFLFSDWRLLRLINWEGKPAISRSLGLHSGHYYVWVLEDYKNQKSVNDDDGTFQFSYVWDETPLLMNREHEKMLDNIDALPRVVRQRAVDDDAGMEEAIKSTLVELKGMKPVVVRIGST